MLKTTKIYASVILFISLVCIGCNNKSQERNSRNMRLPANATHLDFSWPANEAYGLKSIAFHIPRKYIDENLIQIDSYGLVESVRIRLVLNEHPLLDKAINSQSNNAIHNDHKFNTHGFYVKLKAPPDTINHVAERFQNVVVRNNMMIEDGAQGKLNRYSLLECKSPKELAANISHKNNLQTIASNKKLPDNCFLIRSAAYLTNIGSSESLTFPVDVECYPSSCYLNFSVNGRSASINIQHRHLDYAYEIALAAKDQISNYIVHKDK